MRHLAFGSALALAIAASACQPASFNAPSPPGGFGEDGAHYPGGNPYRLLAVEELPIVGVTVDSTLSGYPAARAIDGNLNTQWAAGGYRAATAWAAAELAQSTSLASVAIKTGPLPTGASYDVQVSETGASWTTALANQRNTTWNLETKALPAGTSGKLVRIFFRNSPTQPLPRFSVFELQVSGEAAPGPSPTPSTSPTSTPPSPTPTPSFPPLATTVKLAPTGATASSTYSGLVPGRAIDGNLATQWGSGEYKSTTETLDLSFSQRFAFDQIRIKTGYLPAGVRYDVYTSEDGTTWRYAGWNFTNTTWNLEPKSIYGTGRYLRIQFHNAYPESIARFYVYELEVYGHTPQAQATMTLDVGPDQKTAYGATVGVGGVYEVLNVQGTAYDNMNTGTQFPAMLKVETGRVGTSYQRITPDNTHLIVAELGGPSGVSFLDTVGGLGDNSGSWQFTVRDPNDEVFLVEALANTHVTTWDPANAAYLDLGSVARRYTLSATYVNAPPDQQPPEQDPYHPQAVVVYRKPDGTRDFIIPGGSDPYSNSPSIIEASGYLYAFFVTDHGVREPYATERITLTVNP